VHTLEVVRATECDAGIIALLGRMTFTETFGHLFREKKDLLSYYERTFSVAKIRNSLNKENNLYWLAHVDELPVGYAKLKLNSSNEFVDSDNICQLQKIYVLRDFLSMKIGRELQDMLLTEAKERFFSDIWLSVLNSNQRAISFYERNDFVKVGEHDFQIGRENFDFLAMNKKLS